MRSVLTDFRGVLISLRNNSRKRKHPPFEEQPDIEIEKTEYDFPEVSEEERGRLVKRILDERKRRKPLGTYSILFVSFLLIAVAIGVFAIVGVT